VLHVTGSAFSATDRLAGRRGRLARASLPKQSTGFTKTLNRNCDCLPMFVPGRCNAPHGWSPDCRKLARHLIVAWEHDRHDSGRYQRVGGVFGPPFAIEPFLHHRALAQWNDAGGVLEADEVGRRVATDCIDLGLGKEPFAANEIGDFARLGFGRPASEPFDRPQSWFSAGFDEDDQSHAPSAEQVETAVDREHRRAGVLAAPNVDDDPGACADRTDDLRVHRKIGQCRGN
jgi:hypothetical protein